MARFPKVVRSFRVNQRATRELALVATIVVVRDSSDARRSGFYAVGKVFRSFATGAFLNRNR